MVLQLGEETYRIAFDLGSAEGGEPVPYGDTATLDDEGCHYIALIEDPATAEDAVIHELVTTGHGRSLSLTPATTIHEDVDFGDGEEGEDPDDLDVDVEDEE